MTLVIGIIVGCAFGTGIALAVLARRPAPAPVPAAPALDPIAPLVEQVARLADEQRNAHNETLSRLLETNKATLEQERVRAGSRALFDLIHHTTHAGLDVERGVWSAHVGADPARVDGQDCDPGAGQVGDQAPGEGIEGGFARPIEHRATRRVATTLPRMDVMKARVPPGVMSGRRR